MEDETVVNAEKSQITVSNKLPIVIERSNCANCLQINTLICYLGLMKVKFKDEPR